MDHSAALQQQLSLFIKNNPDIREELRRLVLSKGYRYLKKISMAFVVKPYETDPPAAGEQCQKFQTYNTIAWAFQRTFSIVEQIAQVSADAPKGLIDNER